MRAKLGQGEEVFSFFRWCRTPAAGWRHGGLSGKPDLYEPTQRGELVTINKKAKDTKLVGVDVYIINESGVPQFADFDTFQCEFISNRGTKVWPGYVSPDLMMVNWYRCRFLATSDITDQDIDGFLAKLSEKWLWSAAQKLWLYDGEPGFSKAY